MQRKQKTCYSVRKIPERVYEECQVKLEKATVKSHETIMLTLPIGGCL